MKKWLDKYEAPKAQNGIEGTMGGLTDKGFNYNGAWGGQFQNGGQASSDSVKHQAGKILSYEQLRGGPGGAPLPQYADPKYMNMLMNDIYPEIKKIMPNASAMEAGEAMDFIFNAGWDKDNKKITKDPRAFALQEYYRKNDPSKLDKEGKWSGRKNPAYSFDQEYSSTIGKLPENERRILMNKGRDWYYKNINNPAPGVPNSNYYDTWYGRIWNTNDFNDFNPNNPKFIPKKQTGGVLQSPMAGADQTVPMYQMGGYVYPTTFVPQAQKGLTFLQPTSSKLPEGYKVPYEIPSTELATSIGGEDGEPAFLVPSFKYGQPLRDPIDEFNRTGEHLGGPFKNIENAERFGEMRHRYVERGQNVPSPYKWWDELENGGNVPGSVGFTYARTQGIPSEGPYGKKTVPSAQKGKKIDIRRVPKRTDSDAENLFEILDPTGLSSWDDIIRSYKDPNTAWWETGLEVLGAIPFLGNIAKVTKPGIHLAKYSNVDKALFNTLPKNKSLSRTVSGASKVGRGTDAYQAYDEYQNGGEMQFYQNGLDWTPRNISEYGSEIPMGQKGKKIPDYLKGPAKGDVTQRGNQQLKTEIPAILSREKKAEEKVQKLVQYKNYDEKAARRAVQNKTKVGERDLKEIQRVETRAAAHPDYNPESSYQQMQALSDAGDLRSRILRGANLLTNQGTPLDLVTGLVTDPGRSFANLTLDAKNQYLNPENSALENATNLGLDLLTVAPTAVSKVASKAPQAVKQTGQYLTQGPLKNAYKLNPWAFKPNEANWYRQVGKPAIDDALQSGMIRGRNEEISQESLTKFLSSKPGDEVTAPYFSKGNVYFSDIPNKNYLIETGLPNKNFQQSYMWKFGEGTGPNDMGVAVLHPDPNLRNLGNFNIYEKNWLRGYKEVPKPKSTFKSEVDWGKWNPETPNYPELINEYNAIEESTKKAGTWMKNPDGSPFQGTPEQFIQQQSSYFKKAFPDGFNITYRGANNNATFRGNLAFSDNPNLGAVYTGNKNSAVPKYGSFDRVIRPDELGKSHQGTPGYMQLAYKPSSSSVGFTAKMSNWDNIDRSLLPIEHRNMKAITQVSRENPSIVTTDDIATYIQDKDLDYAKIENINDGTFFGEEIIYNHKPNNYLKSLWHNVGFFDMTNPNIYKAVVPAAIGTTALGAIEQKKKGGVVKDNDGYWNPENWGKVVEIDSPYITMQGVDQDLIGVSDEGDVQYMTPGKDYKFKGKKVKEYPVGKYGINQQDEKTVQHLDQLLNFTNKPKAKNGWLSKYE